MANHKERDPNTTKSGKPKLHSKIKSDHVLYKRSRKYVDSLSHSLVLATQQ